LRIIAGKKQQLAIGNWQLAKPVATTIRAKGQQLKAKSQIQKDLEPKEFQENAQTSSIRTLPQHRDHGPH
jgi:hypothetical protein